MAKTEVGLEDKELAGVAELITEPKPLRLGEYWDYVNKVCPNQDNQ